MADRPGSPASAVIPRPSKPTAPPPTKLLYLLHLVIGAVVLMAALLVYKYLTRDTWESDNRDRLVQLRGECQTLLDNRNLGGAFDKCRDILALIGDRGLKNKELQDIQRFAQAKQTDLEKELVTLAATKQEAAREEERRRKAEKDAAKRDEERRKRDEEQRIEVARLGVGDELGRTALHRAVLAGDAAGVADLTAKGLSLAARDHAGLTPLHLAIARDKLEVAAALLKAGGEVNARAYDGATALHLAAADGRLEGLRFLIGRKAAVNARDQYGRTPAHRAAAAGQLEVIKALEAVAGERADLACATASGETPLHLAAANGHAEVVRFLLGLATVAPDARDKRGHSPLMDAAMRGHVPAVRALVSRADPRAKRPDGAEAMHLAALYGQLDVLQLLVSQMRNLDVSCKDAKGATPLDYALAADQTEAAEFLRNLGAVSGASAGRAAVVQSMLERPVTLRLADAPLPDALRLLKGLLASPISISCAPDFQKVRIVNYDSEGKTLRETLADLAARAGKRATLQVGDAGLRIGVRAKRVLLRDGREIHAFSVVETDRAYGLWRGSARPEERYLEIPKADVKEIQDEE